MTGTEAGPLGTGTARTPEPDGPPPASRLRVGRPGRRTVLVGLVVLTVLAGGATWAVYASSWFRATRVAVSGAGVLTESQIRRAAAVPLGGPLVSVDTGAVRRRLLAALPRIERVAVSRSWPHTVRVTVTERTPSAIVPSGRRFVEVDRGGVRFATVDRAPRGVPVVQLAPVPSPSLRRFGTTRLLQAAIVVAADLPDALRGRAEAIRVRSYDGITVQLTGGRAVVWGSAEDGARKAAVLTSLMKAEPDAVRFDVSAPGAPAASGS